MTRRRPKQLSLFARKRRPRHWKKPGRKPSAERVGFVKHAARGSHDGRHPVHVVMRCVPRAPHLRSERIVNVIAEQLRRAIVRGIRVVHYSIQGDRLHLMVEAGDATTLARGMQWLFSRIAMEVNRVARRAGRLFRDRHFRQELTTPPQVRRAIVYIVMNGRKHGAQQGRSLLPLFEWLDECSSAGYIDKWHDADPPTPLALARARAGPGPEGAKPTTWLLREGWWLRGGGAIRFAEMPAVKLL